MSFTIGMKGIKETLMERDGMEEWEAQDLIDEAKEEMDEYLAVGDYESAYDVCADYFGLEPDYLMELL